MSTVQKLENDVKNNRDVSLDFLKVIATCLIVFHHYQQLTGVRFSYINFWAGKFYFGYLVELFFIISGICASRWLSSLTTESFFEFYIKRAMRLLPLVSISVIADSIGIVAYYLLHHTWVKDRVFDLWGAICACLGIQAGWVVENPMINNPVWYISVLMLCYLVMYFEVWVSKILQIPYEYLFIITIFAGVGVLTYKINFPFFNEYSARGYMAFFWGMIFEKIFQGIDKKSRLVIIGAVLGILVIVFFIIHGYTQNIQYITTFFLWPFLILILRKANLFAITEKSIWTMLSQRSFGVYIWHAVVMRIYYFLPEFIIKYCLNLYAMIGLLVILWGVGFLSYRFLEVPMTKKFILIKGAIDYDHISCRRKQ